MLRKKRSITVRKHSKSAPAAISVSQHISKTRNKWSNESMEAAFKAVEKGKAYPVLHVTMACLRLLCMIV